MLDFELHIIPIPINFKPVSISNLSNYVHTSSLCRYLLNAVQPQKPADDQPLQVMRQMNITGCTLIRAVQSSSQPHSDSLDELAPGKKDCAVS